MIAPGLVVTCAHVVADTVASLPAVVPGQVVALGLEVTLEPLRESYVRDRDSGLDLVLLRITDTPRAPGEALQPVLTSQVAEIGDGLWTFGHPVGNFHPGQSATLRYQGTDLRSDRPDAPWLPRAAGLATEGCSGSAVINTRTGAVCGMLSTSDRYGSVHLVPVAEILARCPEGAEQAALYGAWPRTLTDSQLEAAGWRSPTPKLLAYLNAAADVADRAHPYPVIEGEPPSSLSIVYVRQFAGRDAPAEETNDEKEKDGQSGSAVQGAEESQKLHASRSASERIRAEELFELGKDVVLVGAPGAGKSSLLRHAVTELAHRWSLARDWSEERRRPGVVPVRVEAREFLADKGALAIIAQAGKGELSAPSVTGWPTHWFDRAPVPGARWLVLVDGLDEAGGPRDRSRVLQKIADLREMPSVGDHFRFLVATRPLPASELPGDMVLFDLLPLDPAQLPDFAGGWFMALGLEDAAGAVPRFMDRLNSSGMSEPARTPLMAAMLCQLFAADQNKPLPRGRTAVYRQFVEEILNGQSWSRRKVLSPQVRDAALRSHGPEGVNALQAVRAKLDDLIGHLAFARHEGRSGSAVQLLAEACACPKAMKERIWADLLALALPEFLRDCGLLVQRRKDFVFIHQTFAEYLVASRIANNDRLSQKEFRRFFGCDPRLPAWALRLSRVSEPAATSVARFLIDAWEHEGQRGLHQALRLVAKRQAGAMFISTLVDDGAEIDDAVRKSATSALHSAARNGDHGAAVALARIGDPRGAEILAAAARVSADRAGVRLQAACGLADLGDIRGMATLRMLAADATGPECVGAAEELVRRADPGGADALLRLARDPTANRGTWVDAARALDRLGLPGGIEALMARMLDKGEPFPARLAAAQQLVDSGAPGVAEPLADMVREDLQFGDRLDALRLLGKLRSDSGEAVRAAELLAVLADDNGLPAEVLMAAAEQLGDHDRRARAYYTAAMDPTANTSVRLRALGMVPNKADGHVTDILLPVLVNPRARVMDRRAAAQLLPPTSLRQTEIQLALRSLLTSLSAKDRLALVKQLAPERPGGKHMPSGSSEAPLWWYDMVCDVVVDRSQTESERRRLMEVLKHRGAQNHLTALARSADVPGALRLVAAREAMALAASHGPSTEEKPWAVRDAALLLSQRTAALAVIVWYVATPVVRRMPSTLHNLARGAGSVAEQCLYLLVRLPFLALVGVLPIVVAVAANAFGAACLAETPPADWKLRVYCALTVLLIIALYRGASAFAGTSHRGSKVLLWGFLLAAALGLLRAPGLPGLNAMGDYLVAVIPWDGEPKA
ncbi:trypsin-like peptidase domain-containing protein [Streptomyces sp. NPDC005141]